MSATRAIPSRRKPRPGRTPALVFLAAALAAGVALQAGSAKDGSSRVNELLNQLKRPKASAAGERFELSERDLNEFAGVVIGSRKNLGVRSILLDLQPGGVIAGVAVVDMDQVQVGGFAASMFKTVLSGTQTIKTTGRLSVKNRRAEYDIEEASFNGVWVPAWLVNSVVGYLGGKQPPHVDITEPFDLPFGIADVRVEADRLVILR